MNKVLEKEYVGILGGSFDPAHNGHVLISGVALDHGLDAIVWLVTEQNPLKKKPGLSKVSGLKGQQNWWGEKGFKTKSRC